MVMAMSSAFTTTDRRKKLATYGRSARPATSISWNDDAPSPERPRKHTALNGRLQRTASAVGERSTSGAPHAKSLKSPTTHDIFDVPSDDDVLQPAPTPVPTRKEPLQKNPPVDDFEVPSSGDEASLPKRRPMKGLKSSHKSETLCRPVQSSKTLPKNEGSQNISSDNPIAMPQPRAKTPKVPSGSQGGQQKATQRAKPPASKPKVLSRATTPAPLPSVSHKKTKSNISLPPKKDSAKPSAEVDIFDVPSDNELRTPRRPRPAPFPQPKSPTTAPGSGQLSPGLQIDSDESTSSKKRKRQGSSQLSTATRRDGAIIENNEESAVPARGHKIIKNQSSLSPGHVPPKTVKHTTKPVGPTSNDAIVNKPSRTRIRTGPSSSLPPIVKGQSSPAKLHGMLAVRSAPKSLPKPPPAPKAVVVTDLEDETMYDIGNPSTPLTRPNKPNMSGSVTPRQREMFGNLLGDTSDSGTPGMPTISRLQLTDRRPGSTTATLARSSSDIPRTAYSRKPRLIDTLIQAAPIEEDDSGSDEDAEEDIMEAPQTTFNAPSSTTNAVDDMDVDPTNPSDSQTLQNTLHVNSGARVTYASQRSYLEEANLEDGLFLAMGIDDSVGLLSNNAPNPDSDDEDDPASQVRGIHELRKQGQNQKFQMEAQTAIDDISGKGGLGSSVRRSAMIEFCTQMAEEEFIEQLLNSALAQRFLRSITSTGEIIFDFTTIVAIAFLVQSAASTTLLEQIHKSVGMATVWNLLEIDTDISRIAKERKTNMSKVGRESVTRVRTLVQGSPIWSVETPKKVSPQIVALKTLELILLGLRKAGSTEALISEDIVGKLLRVSSAPCERLKGGVATSQDYMVLNLAFSVLEAASLSKQATWSNDIVRRLVEMMPVLFDTSGASPIKLAVRLCMTLTNNKPKACEAFAGPAFVQPLTRAISHRFTLLGREVDAEQRNEMLESLILCLGAMINLAEFSDQARRSVTADSDELIDALAMTFLEGSERAAQADSLEESQTNVAIGYLTVLLGNLCLNEMVRRKVSKRLPGHKMDALVEKIKEFVSYNEKVDRMTSQFEGEEGRETWRNFTLRLMLVVEKLEKAES